MVDLVFSDKQLTSSFQFVGLKVYKMGIRAFSQNQNLIKFIFMRFISGMPFRLIQFLEQLLEVHYLDVETDLPVKMNFWKRFFHDRYLSLGKGTIKLKVDGYLFCRAISAR